MIIDNLLLITKQKSHTRVDFRISKTEPSPLSGRMPHDAGSTHTYFCIRREALYLINEPKYLTKTIFFMHKKYIKYLFLVPLLATILYACMDDGDWFSTKRVSSETKSAKLWYEAVVGDAFITLQLGGEEVELLPDWRTAFSNQNETYRVTEVSLTGLVKRIRNVDSESYDRFRETGDRSWLTSDTRLVIRMNKETGETVGFIMMVHPCAEFLAKNVSNPLRTVTYLHRRADFVGTIYYYHLTGEFAQAFHIVGELVYSMLPSAVVENNPELRSSYRCEWLKCTITFVDFYQIIQGEFVLTHSFEKFRECWEIGCFHSYDGTPYLPPSSGGNDGGNGGGSGQPPGNNNNNNPPPPTTAERCAPEASQIFTNALMNCNEWEQLERIVNSIKLTCIGRGLYNSVLNRAEGSINLTFTSDVSSAFDRGRNTLTLSSSGDHIHIFHELFHVTQVGRTRGEREVEAWFATFIYAMDRDSGFGPGSSLYNEFGAEDELGEVLRVLNGIVNNRGALNSGRNQEQMRDIITVGGGLLDQLGSFGYSFTATERARTNFTITNTFRNLQQITRGC